MMTKLADSTTVIRAPPSTSKMEGSPRGEGPSGAGGWRGSGCGCLCFVSEEKAFGPVEPGKKEDKLAISSFDL